MKNQLGIIVLILICVGLIVALVVSQKKSTEQHTRDVGDIATKSNELVKTTTDLEDERKTNAQLNQDLDSRKTELQAMTNHLTDVSDTLAKTAETLKAAQAQMAKEVSERDARIADLESKNSALDQRAIDLTTAITNLTSQIDDTQKKLAASEGDKAFLQKELQRLMAEKAELERQFNDLKILRTQVAKLQEQLTISRRLQWIREGLFARDAKKGAELLMEKTPLTNTASSSQTKPGKYDLNVEVSADGTVKVIPPLTNAPAATNPPPQ